ncbi:MAG: Gfo/Idh/MocA family oxidoreductase, partial [Phycisphaerales bacterium]
MLRVGIAGLGFMGRIHYKYWKALQGAEVAAICDANPNIEEDVKRAVGNIGEAEDAIDFASLQLYTDFDKMLSDGELDAISLTLPTYLHADYSIKALAAGVNVLCEKPMTRFIAEGRAVAEAEKRYKRIFQVGTFGRFGRSRDPRSIEIHKIMASGL